ncbi:hypothetical protein SCHPADRAFT_891039 [Schizopora paradoxa]|uniref:Uncharacterized protein n=1 Tax=Schizopora paradoxa TaxID=27342 RepID=A0A0H2S5E1_9AGAM|nr:hypothetical protein SCHPADRAFT_891039 [Schizopora paradoxa]
MHLLPQNSISAAQRQRRNAAVVAQQLDVGEDLKLKVDVVDLVFECLSFKVRAMTDLARLIHEDCTLRRWLTMKERREKKVPDEETNEGDGSLGREGTRGHGQVGHGAVAKLSPRSFSPTLIIEPHQRSQTLEITHTTIRLIQPSSSSCSFIFELRNSSQRSEPHLLSPTHSPQTTSSAYTSIGDDPAGLKGGDDDEVRHPSPVLAIKHESRVTVSVLNPPGSIDWTRSEDLTEIVHPAI